MEICKKENCTGCGACAFVCPKQCISMKEPDIGVVYPVVDDSVCIKCGSCQGICPQLDKVSYNKPKRAYAAWSADAEERRTSASGGIAAEIYKLAAQKGMLIVGAECKPDFSVELSLTDDIKRLKAFKNSKYVFSTAYGLYPQLREALKTEKHIVVIGLPCQIAAVKKLFKNNDKLTLIDVVCHGVTPVSYLRQHIAGLENKMNEKAKNLSFRTPELGTSKYVFSLYNNQGKRFYSKRTADGDTYQYGYHRMVAYRENCYHCLYARGERISDITLSDYKGLGKLAPCDYDEQEVSSVLVNTDKGQRLIDELRKNKCIVSEERPVTEPIMGDMQLQHPSVKKKTRSDFERIIVKTHGDFETTMKKVMRREKIREYLRKIKRKLRKLI